MLIWTGWGILAAVFSIGAMLLVDTIVDSLLGPGYYKAHQWPKGLALILGGVLTAISGVILKTRHDREVEDVQTGERFTINMSSHTFFFVPLHWAGLAIAMIGCYMLAAAVIL